MSGIKSSYQLARERLEKENPAARYTLTDSQKKQLAELEKIFTAKIAESEMALSEQIRNAQSRNDEELAQKLRERLRTELQKLSEEKESKKRAVRLSKK